MMGLSDGRKSFQIGLAVLIQYQRVIQPASHPASHVSVAMTCLLRRAGKNSFTADSAAIA